MGAVEVSVIVAIKLLAHLLLTWPALVVALDMESSWTQVGILLSGLPTGATEFVLVRQFGVFV